MGKGSARRKENMQKVLNNWPFDYRIPGGDRLMCAKELAAELGHHVNFIYSMKADGFPMPGGSSTINLALTWLDRNPHPRRRKA